MKRLMMTVGAVMLSAAVWAAAGSFAYQGVLRNEVGGRIASATATITFRIYDGPGDGANMLWNKEMTLSIDTNGLFNAELSGNGKTSGASLEKAIADAQQGNGKTLYVGLTVKDSAGEIRPRQKIIATPIALFAKDVNAASGNFTVNGNATVKGNLAMGDGSRLTIKQAEVSGTFTANGGLTVANQRTQLMGGATVDNGLTANALTVQKTATVADLVVSGTAKTSAGVDLGVPKGCILMWSGAADKIPAGWALCDGKVHDGVTTPNLCGRFIVGVGTLDGATYAPGNIGGVQAVTLTTNQIPSHTHQFDDWRWQGYESGRRDLYEVMAPSGKGFHDGHELKTQSTGGNEAHENRPPYYALCYIMKVK